VLLGIAPVATPEQLDDFPHFWSMQRNIPADWVQAVEWTLCLLPASSGATNVTPECHKWGRLFTAISNQSNQAMKQ